MHSLTVPSATSRSTRPALDSPPATTSRSTSFRTRPTSAPSSPSRRNSQLRNRTARRPPLLPLPLCMSFYSLGAHILTLPPFFSLAGLSATTNPTQTAGTGTDTNTNDLNPTGTTNSTSKNGAERTKAAGGVGLIFGVLAAMAL
jgi:hypothetical protein